MTAGPPKVPGIRPSIRLPGRIGTRMYEDGRISILKWRTGQPVAVDSTQWNQNQTFGWVCWATKYRVALEQEAAQLLSPTSFFYPRDLLEMATFGQLVQIVQDDGTIYYGERLVTKQAQVLLDQITTVNGSLLTRGADGWMGIPAGTADYVLKSQGPGNIPAWAPVSSGGGGNGWQLLDSGIADDATTLASPAVDGDGTLKLLFTDLTVATKSAPRIQISASATVEPTATDNNYITRSAADGSGTNTNKIAQYHYQAINGVISNMRFEHECSGPWGSAGSYIHKGIAGRLEELIGDTQAADARSHMLFIMNGTSGPIAFSGQYYWLWQATPVGD